MVAPHAGAWIETSRSYKLGYSFIVAPHAGAWIETPVRVGNAGTGKSRPSRRGVDRNG